MKLTNEQKKELIGAYDKAIGFPRCDRGSAEVVAHGCKCLCPKPCPFWTETSADPTDELPTEVVALGLYEMGSENKLYDEICDVLESETLDEKL